MDAKAALASSFNVSSMVLKSYVSDLDDGDLLTRPGKGCNHLAWQLGHLISSEVHLLGMISPDNATELPEGFGEAHGKENNGCDDAAQFLGRDAYVELFDKVRAASLEAISALPETDLDKPAPEQMRSFCPTVGDFLALVATHPMMHAGQFAVARRQLDKPVLM